MIVTETIPTILTWAEIKAHCRIEEDTEQDYLTSLALACAQAFEKETDIAVGSRTITVTYSVNDMKCDYNRIHLPKGPVVSITSIANEETTLDGDTYELRKIGHTWYVYLTSTLSTPITVTYVAGHSSVPQLVKQAVLIHVDHLWRNRGATSGQQQYSLEHGLDRIHSLYKTAKAVVG